MLIHANYQFNSVQLPVGNYQVKSLMGDFKKSNYQVNSC